MFCITAIVESDSLIAIQVINRKSIHPRQICNLIEDTNMLGKKSRILKFAYCRRSANELTDRIANEASAIVLKNLLVVFLLLFIKKEEVNCLA